MADRYNDRNRQRGYTDYGYEGVDFEQEDRGWQQNRGRRQGSSQNRQRRQSDYNRQGNRDLERGTIYDRSARDRGNYDLSENQDYENWEGEYYTGEYYDEYGTPYTWTYTEFWNVPGPYTGMGPQGYHRSDDAVKEDVCERLTQHGQIDARDVSVDVNNGEVTLRGTVPDRRSKRMAEDVADSVYGVNDIHNELKINRSQSGQHNQGQQSQQNQQYSQGQQSQQNTRS